MARMIDAEKAYETVVDLSGQADTKSAYAAFWKAGKEIRKLPTVDAVEVVHGRWEPHPNHHGFDRCSVCRGCIVANDWIDGRKWKFCPECGAKMDGERKDND